MSIFLSSDDWINDPHYHWGIMGCSAPHCENPAELLLDSEETPYCFDCVEKLIERQEALAIHPGLMSTLPPLWE